MTKDHIDIIFRPHRRFCEVLLVVDWFLWSNFNFSSTVYGRQQQQEFRLYLLSTGIQSLHSTSPSRCLLSSLSIPQLPRQALLILPFSAHFLCCLFRQSHQSHKVNKIATRYTCTQRNYRLSSCEHVNALNVLHRFRVTLFLSG